MKTLVALLLLLPICLQAKMDKQSGMFSVPVLSGKSAINVWYQLPEKRTSYTPIVFVMHGMMRNADEYRDAWVQLAKENHYIVVVPEFDRERFPGAQGYNLGNMLTEEGDTNPEEQWSFSMVEPIFDNVKQQLQNRTEKFYIFGHSAGSQFVHRLLMFKPDLPVAMAVAANAGWYTLPTTEQTFPYGLAGLDAQTVNVSSYLSKPMVLLLGDQDNDPKDDSLRTTPEANLQGPHRFARGQNYFAMAQQQAKSLGVTLNWRLEVAPGVAHDNWQIAPFAAKAINQHLAENSPDKSVK